MNIGLFQIGSTHYRNLTRAMYDRVMSWSLKGFKVSRCFCDAQIWASPRCANNSPYASNRHASPRHRDIEKKSNACIESETSRIYLGDTSTMFPTCLGKHRRCLFDVMISPMVWVIRRRCSPIFATMAMLRWAFSIFNLRTVRRQHNKSDLLFIHDRIKEFSSHKVCGSTPQGTMPSPGCHRYDFVKTPPQHRQDITITAPTQARYLSVQGI